MGAYYNEIDPYAAQWLRNLISAGHIAPGDVDERSIVDVRADDLRGYTQCHFFAGIAGWSLALRLAGWPDDRPVWTGSCPCQPFSLAGAQKGFNDDRHLWPVWRELISERRPAKVFGEQVAGATEWLGLVRGDLEALDYAVGAVPIQAASAGAYHLRDRYWFVADAPLPSEERQRSDGREILSDKATNGRSSAGNMGDAGSTGLAFRSIAEVERGDVRFERPAASSPGVGSIAMADSDIAGAGKERAERSGQFSGAGGDQEARALGDGGGTASEWNARELSGAEAEIDRARELDGREPDGSPDAGASALEWVIGADGKARRVKSGIRLLAHDVPARVGKLRAFGNAIVPQVAAEFIRAAA